MELYASSIIGISLLCLMSILLSVYSGVSKGQAGQIAGPVADARDDNRLYRIDRVHMNGVEALAAFAVATVLAMISGVSPGLLAWLVWAHVAFRLVHGAVYLRGGNAAKGGNLRTVLHVGGSLATLAILVATILKVL